MPIINLTRIRIISGLFLVTFSSLAYFFVLHRSASLDWLTSSYGYALPSSLTSHSSTNYTMRVTPIHAVGQILVVSLPRRLDRRKGMEVMRKALQLDWSYIDAFDSNETVVDNVLHHVHALRDFVARSRGRKNATFYPDPDLWLHTNRAQSLTSPPKPMACAKDEDTIPDFSPSLHKYEILSRGMIACWLSHLMALRIAALESAPTMILEDDLDFDWDFVNIINSNWHVIPPSWEIVYLGSRSCFNFRSNIDYRKGYCWSNETQYQPLPHSTLVRPSDAPKCSHAYIVSQTGAQKILDLLRRPNFAFSRALDQALSYLIQKKVIESYSFVPSLVVQTKNSVSDIWGGTAYGSSWRENLTHSTRLRLDSEPVLRSHPRTHI